MLKTLAIRNYRSILNLLIPLGQLNIITGANGSGKSNLYRALRLLAETAQNGVVNSLASEGGLESTMWAGPEKISAAMQRGEVAVQGGQRKNRLRMKLGFSGEDFGYSISLGLPTPSRSAFMYDPEIKHECIWAGELYRPACALIQRNGSVIKIRSNRTWKVVSNHLQSFDSLFSEIADPSLTPEAIQMREIIRSWRFYDHFRTDKDSPARSIQLGTRTPVLHHDGRDLAAALQTIYEIGDSSALDIALDDAFPGSRLSILRHENGFFGIELTQPGLLRSLSGSELSDGTLRYLLWVAALLTPRPPSLMVLNEPETSLHPDLLPALARLIIRASEQSQVWVVSHATRLIAALEQHPDCHSIQLVKNFSETRIPGQSLLSEPAWYWPDNK